MYICTCKVSGVIRRCILGALERAGFPSFWIGRFTTNRRTSSSLDKLNSLRILLALLGPKRRGTSLSVKSGISYKNLFKKNMNQSLYLYIYIIQIIVCIVCIVCTLRKNINHIISQIKKRYLISHVYDNIIR